MAKINPYLNFPGNTEEAFNFYKSVFGGEFAGGIFRFTDTPDSEKMSETDRQKVMHVALPIGKDNLLMATDALESLGFNVTFGNNIHLSLETETKDEAEKLFNKLSAGGNITMPLSDQFWGAYFGSLIDKFGIHWMVNYTYTKN